MSRRTKSCIWLAVAMLAFGSFLYTIHWGELNTAIHHVSWPGLVLALCIVLCSNTIIAIRWFILLRVQQISVAFRELLKLTYLGLFYANMMPGTLGGDVLKVWFIRYHCDRGRRLDAAVTVFMDRLTGLTGLVVVGTAASFFIDGELRTGFGIQIRSLIWCIFGLLVLGVGALFNRRIRRALMLGHLLNQLPLAGQLRKMDASVQLYRQHMPTMLTALSITLVNLGLATMAIWIVARSLHLDNVEFMQCLTIMPIIWVVSAAVPVPGGLGVMEYLFIPFFAMAIAPHGAINAATGTFRATVVAQATALALVNRAMICASSIPGALLPIWGGHLPKTGEMEQELE